MKVRIAFALVLVGVAAPASAMTVAEFMGKVAALKAKGPMALFSSDIGVLKAEGAAAGQSIRQDQESAMAAGRPAPTCVPKGVKIGSNELLSYFDKIPPAQQRSMTVKQGMVGLFRQKWPCR